MSTRSDDFAAHDRDQRAARIARRIDREIRRRAERRRTAILTGSLLLAGVLLLAGGVTVVAATRGERPEGRTSQAFAETETPGSAATSSVPEDVVQTDEAPEAVPTPKADEAPVRPRPAKNDMDTSEESVPPKKSSTPKTGGSEILVKKCARSSCHTVSQVKSVELDVESARDTVDGMVDGGYVDLTKDERAAVIAALTGK